MPERGDARGNLAIEVGWCNCFVDPRHGIECFKWVIFGKQNWQCSMNRKLGFPHGVCSAPYARCAHAAHYWGNLSQGSIDVYAAQCKECLKWRVIDSEGEFEEIRQKVIEEPFYCNKKANTSCEDPADIDYDASRTWVIDKPNLPKTPQGFKRSLVLRKDYSKLDPYFIAPTGKKLRTRNEMASFLNEHPEVKNVSASDFDFSTPKIMADTVPESAGKDSANKKSKKPKDDNQIQSSL
ncbi:methyl-CpG-binding domain-containing protein 4-like [Senna tora]|uniref:Methyl-CpG-binding domain-containing protein 4-like n=1 Tax=Senna tora TaxID=362788 RepID=A0A834TIV2_9FABA|nr:methyl-CpG-binding domain-containing protein 4-like [Senna tora]